MVRITKVHTGGGDGGETSLVDGTRIAKSDLRMEMVGTCDELNACLGIVAMEANRLNEIAEDGGARPTVRQVRNVISKVIGRLHHELFDLGAELSIPINNENMEMLERTKITEKQIERLENEIDQLNANLSDLESFILPGGTLASSYLHLARTVVRKAERLMVKMDNLEKNSVSDTALKYINRLSDLLFVAARYANQSDIGGTGDVLWKPGSSREE